MGQTLLDPPSVEGWHTGVEWINSSALMRRVNFAVKEFSDVNKPGVRSIISRIKAGGPCTSPELVVRSCLDLMGPLHVSAETMDGLLAHATAGGDILFGSEEEDRVSADRVKEILQLIVATREYQMA